MSDSPALAPHETEFLAKALKFLRFQIMKGSLEPHQIVSKLDAVLWLLEPTEMEA
jgi:hypothetical protein